jgi:TolA-binding protein
MKNALLVIVLILGIFFSGCVSNTVKEQVSPTATLSPQISSTESPTSTQISQSSEQNKINELESKINSMQQQINDLQTSVNRVDLLKPSNNKLIPEIPFKIEVYWGEMQSPQTYTFKNDIDVIIGDGYGNYDYATYTLFRNNNTIKINSKKYQFYGLSLYDDYIASTYKNGWIGWVTNYKIFPPKYNPLTQKYELN